MLSAKSLHSPPKKQSQGFRKIDTDKWEFRNGGFVRGQRHLLKTIQRRKSHHQHKGPSTTWLAEIRELRGERRLMMEEVMGLQDEQCLTVQHMHVVKEKLEAAETRHKQMISFLARLLNSGIPSSSRTMRKFVKHQTELCSFDVTPDSDQPSSQHQIREDEFNHAPKKDDSVGAMNPPANEHFVSSPQNVVMENGVPGFLRAGDAWSTGLEAGDPWGYVSNYYEAPDLGVESGLLDVSEIGPMQLEGSSDIKEWLDEESPVNNGVDPSIKK